MHLVCRHGWSVLALGVLASSGCSVAVAGSPARPPISQYGQPATRQPADAQAQAAAEQPIALAGQSPSPTPAPSPSRPAPHSTPAARPLAGKIIGVDPGHNGRNKDDPSYIDRQIWNGREWENCDTTGTETGSGYTEARFNFNVATDLKADLIKDGAKVVMTRHSNNGVGPCVNKRAEIINHARANVSIDIHADGGPAWGRGFTVLEPVADGQNNKVIKSSVRFGSDVRAAILKDTSMPESDYYGHHGIIVRNDLAGLNLTRVPKILIESGNMRNSTDARVLTRPSFQRRLARAFAAAIVKFLTGK